MGLCGSLCLKRRFRRRSTNGAPARQLLLRCPTFRPPCRSPAREGAFVVADVQGRTSVAVSGRKRATKVTKTILPRGCYTGTYECREWMDPQERPSAHHLDSWWATSDWRLPQWVRRRRIPGADGGRMVSLPCPLWGRASAALVLGLTVGAKRQNTYVLRMMMPVGPS